MTLVNPQSTCPKCGGSWTKTAKTRSCPFCAEQKTLSPRDKGRLILDGCIVLSSMELGVALSNTQWAVVLECLPVIAGLIWARERALR
jgi:hypothetical protein